MIRGQLQPVLAILGVLALLSAPPAVHSQSPAPAQPAAPAAQKPARPHRVITNEDIPSRIPGNSTPEIEARLEQLNLCDRACFAQVFKDSQLAFRQRYNYSYPFSNKDDHTFEDAILSRMDSLRANADWQNLLRNALIAQAAFCRASHAEQSRRTRQDANGKPITASDVAAEETAAKNAPRVPNYNNATSAIIAYKFKIEKDALLASIVLYKYFEILRTNCLSYPSAE